MKARFRVYVLALALILFSMFIACSNAYWSSLTSGYALTTNYENNVTVPGTLVTATAGTTDTSVQNVTFIWYDPNGIIAFQDSNIVAQPNGTKWADGKVIYYAQSSHRPNALGYWGVQAIFIGSQTVSNQCIPNIKNIQNTIFKIGGPSNFVPEFPILGSAGAALVMSFGFGLFLTKRKKSI